jgi:hypothetical protein
MQCITTLTFENLRAGMHNLSVLVFANLDHGLHSAQADELCRFIVRKAPKPPHLPDQYIPPNKWLDYSHSKRTTGRSLPTRRGLPTAVCVCVCVCVWVCWCVRVQ